MRKIISLSLVSALGTLLLVGCGSTNTVTPESINDTHMQSTHISKHLTQKKVHKLIVEAANNNGWETTEFKSNAIIAEKTNGEDTTAVTINFDRTYFELNPTNSDLQNILEDALK